MLVNKTVEFFLSEAAGWGWRSAVSGGGLGRDVGDQITGQAAGSERPETGTRCRRGPRPGLGQNAGDQITGQVADSERPGTGQDAGGGRG